MLQKPIIEIKRASDRVTTALIASGILIVTDTGLKCAEQKSPAAGKHTGLIKKYRYIVGQIRRKSNG